MAVLRLQNVGFGYPGSADILRDVSFTLQPGTLTFITGARGSGKTTLLRLCHLRAKVTRGEIFLLGRNVVQRSRQMPELRRRIGVIFEDLRLIDELSAFDNVALPLHLAGRRRPDYAKDVNELLTWAGLGEKMNEPASSLSASERQRVAIARALVSKPELLLADEPLIRLDDEAGERVMKLLFNIHQFGTTVLITARNLDPAIRTGGRELHLADGCIMEMAVAA
jgi:cell division transport system ATP-binding protein